MGAGCLVLLSAGSACTNDAGSGETTGGIPIPHPSDTAHVEVLHVLGGGDADLFGDIGSADFFVGDSVVVADRFLHQVLVFDRVGDLVHRIGRDGDGPGEISGPSGVVSLPDGRMAVLSHGLSRVSVFGKDGGEPETFGVNYQGQSRPWLGSIGEGPTLYDWHFDTAAEEVLTGGSTIASIPVGQGSGRPQAIQTLPPHQTAEARWTDAAGRVRDVLHPYGRGNLWSVNQDGDFAFLSLDSVHIEVGTIGEGVTARLRLPGDWRPPTQDLELAETFLQGMLGPGEIDVQPAELPAITSLYLDDDMRSYDRKLWIAPSVGA